MKMLVFIGLVFGLCKIVSAEETFTYSQSMECFVKSYENRVFKFVDDEYFVGKALRVAELRRTPDFVAFKVNGKMYVAPKKCMQSENVSDEDLEPRSAVVFPDEKKEEARAKKIRNVLNQREKRSNFLAFSLAMQTTSSKEIVSKDDQFYLESGESSDGLTVISASKPNQKKSENNLVFQLEYGSMKDVNLQWLIGLKKSGKKTSETQSAVFDVSGVPVDSFVNLDWKIDSVDLQTGYAYLFDLNDSNELAIFGLIGLINADAAFEGSINVNGVLESFGGDKFSGTGFIGTLGVRYQSFLSDAWSIQAKAGYEYVSSIKFKLKGTENSDSPTGFNSNSILGGTLLSLGTAWHF